MKKLLLLVLLAMTTTIVHTQDSVFVTAPGASLDRSEQPQRVSGDDIVRYRGAYQLSSGQTLTLKGWGGRLYAAVDGQAQHELAATGEHGFTARDGLLKMHIELQGDGRASGQLLMWKPARDVADGGTGKPEPVVLALR